MRGLGRWTERLEVEESSETNSKSYSTDARFSMGIKAKDAPYEDYTVGALLLVTGKNDELKVSKNNYKGVRVLSSSNTIVVTEDDLKYYFVANDCFAEGNGSLTVNIWLMRNSKEAAKRAFKALSEIRERIDSEVRILLR